MARQKAPVKVSLVITVLNEQESIEDLLQALKHQSRPPDEVIIVDGGSRDNTVRLISSWLPKIRNLRLFTLPGANRSRGRNFGVSKAKYPTIAFTDAGCVPRPDWLLELMRPFQSDKSVQVVSGYYRGLPQTIFEKCLVPYVLVMPDRAEKAEFFPSTRSMAITRSAWDKSGGFDSRLNYNEDYAFAHWLKTVGFTFHFAPRAVVGWYPRKTLSSAAKMFFYFALGDIQAKIFRPQVKNLFIRYLVFTYLFLFSLENRTFLIFLILPLIFAYISLSVIKNYRYIRSPQALFWLPVIQITADLSIMWGTLIGFLSRAYGIS